MSKNSIRIWLLISVLLAIGVAPFLAQGDQATIKLREENAQEIAMMSQSERDRLERNFAAYQSMPPKKIAELKAFHQKLEEDRNQSSGDLSVAMEQYNEWLNTIEPLQRDQLKATTDPQERLKLMSRFVREQRERDVSSVFRRRFANSPFAKFTVNTPVLNLDELKELMERIEIKERDQLTVSQKSEINRKVGIARFLTLLNMLKQNSTLRPQDRGKIPPWINAELFLTFRRTESLIESSVQNQDVLNYVTEQSYVSGREIPKAFKVQAVLIKSLCTHVDDQLDEAAIPPHQKIVQLFEELPEEEQEQLLELQANDFYMELVARSDIETPEDNQVSLHDVFEVFKPAPEDQSRWSPGKRPGGGSMNGERPPPGRERRPGDGPPDRNRDGFRGGRDGDGRPFDRERRFDDREPREERPRENNSER